MKKIWQAIRSKTLSQNQKLIIILIIGFLHGLIYIFVTPPWWHHDEPGHFQVAWFIANHDRRPKWNEFDDAMRIELVESLERHHLFDYINYSPGSNEEMPNWVLLPQALDPPLYYAVASLPLRLLKNTTLDLQNRTLRLLSLGFFLLFLWVSWELGGDLFGPKHPLRIMSTAFLALLPGFVNEMTAIMNTALGTLLFAFFLLAGLRLLKYGFSWKNVIFLSSSAIACYYTNNLVWISVGVLTTLLILFMSFRKRVKWLPWAAILSMVILLPLLIIQWGDARYWYRNVPSEIQTRQLYENAPFGDYVLQIPYNDTLRQRIPVEFLKPQRSETLTLGFWAWASESVDVVIAPQIIFSTNDGIARSPRKKIKLSTQPEFYSLQLNTPSDSGRGWLLIKPAKNNEDFGATIYFDGIVLAEDEREGIPEFTDNYAGSGTWDNHTFENLIRNASFEKSWFRFSSFLLNHLPKNVIKYIPVSSMATLQDWAGSGWYFKQTLVVLNETFWGRFGPSTIPILGDSYTYQFLRLTVIIGFLGILVMLWNKLRALDKRILVFLGLSIIIIWGQTVLRGAGSLDAKNPIIPWTRYSLPAILPTAMALCTGWYILLSKTETMFKIQSNSLVWAIFIAFMLSLDMLSILTMLQFFYLQTQWTYLALFIAQFLSLFFLLVLSKQSILNPKGE